MSARNLVNATNIALLLAGVYFAAVAALGEGSLYSIAGTILCFIAVGLALKKDFVFTGPWRVATAAFSFVIFTGQVIANVSSPSFSNIYTVGSTLINGAFLFVFIGVILTTSRGIMKKSKDEESEEEEKPTKKLTYQV